MNTLTPPTGVHYISWSETGKPLRDVPGLDFKAIYEWVLRTYQGNGRVAGWDRPAWMARLAATAYFYPKGDEANQLQEAASEGVLSVLNPAERWLHQPSGPTTDAYVNLFRAVKQACRNGRHWLGQERSRPEISVNSEGGANAPLDTLAGEKVLDGGDGLVLPASRSARSDAVKWLLEDGERPEGLEVTDDEVRALRCRFGGPQANHSWAVAAEDYGASVHVYKALVRGVLARLAPVLGLLSWEGSGPSVEAEGRSQRTARARRAHEHAALGR